LRVQQTSNPREIEVVEFEPAVAVERSASEIQICKKLIDRLLQLDDCCLTRDTRPIYNALPVHDTVIPTASSAGLFQSHDTTIQYDTMIYCNMRSSLVYRKNQKKKNKQKKVKPNNRICSKETVNSQEPGVSAGRRERVCSMTRRASHPQYTVGILRSRMMDTGSGVQVG